MSGSDDGVLFICDFHLLMTLIKIGDRKTSKIVQLLKADSSVTNVMTGHPYHPILAVSGIDKTVKIFSPEGVGEDLQTRQSLHDQTKICSKNSISRRSQLRGTFLTRDVLEALAINLRARRTRENPEGPGGCETM
jgi:DDB1- and CUL4-associated factor 6